MSAPANQALNLALQPGLMGGTQTVAASFASVNNNTSPRFGVVVRAQNAQNYYVCYRQVGSSSVVRIAKIQNGVETVLKSAGLPNPAINAFSTLTCQASGSALTSQLDGKAMLSVTDGTFTTGSVGFSMKSTTAGAYGAHRVDNFSATLQ